MKLGTAELGIAALAILLLPTTANAACRRGPAVVVNRGHGASITFTEPVYQSQVFDISKLILEPIPDQGTRTLILTAVDSQDFPGLPQTSTTTLLASTSNECYIFDISFGTHSFHNTVSAVPEAPTLLRAALLPGGETGGENVDVEILRTKYAAAVEQHGEGNMFLQRVAKFLELVDSGIGQRLAAQQAEVEWSHLTELSKPAIPEPADTAST